MRRAATVASVCTELSASGLDGLEEAVVLFAPPLLIPATRRVRPGVLEPFVFLPLTWLKDVGGTGLLVVPALDFFAAALLAMGVTPALVAAFAVDVGVGLGATNFKLRSCSGRKAVAFAGTFARAGREGVATVAFLMVVALVLPGPGFVLRNKRPRAVGMKGSPHG